tara:strand:- start:1807 stop:3105 length:1299 start_codon:yes stop_codon:yes gene_type:complete
MYGGLARGQGAYDMGGSAISQRASAYRSDVDNIKGANKALMKQAEAATDLTALRDIGVEGAIKMLKPKIGGIIGKVYKSSGLKDWDLKTTKKINDWRKANGLDNDDNEGRSGESGEINGEPSTSSETTGGDEPNNFVSEDSDPSSRGDIQVEPDDDASPEPTDAPPDPPSSSSSSSSSSGQGQLEDAEPRAPNRMGDDPTNEMTYDDAGDIENFGDEGEETGATDGDFDRFMADNTGTPMTESGDIDFDAPENSMADMGRLQEQRRPRLGDLDGSEPQEGSPTEPGDQITGNGDNMPTDDAPTLEDAPRGGGNALEDAGDAGEEAATAGEEGASTALTTTAEGLETAGAVADSTGIGAILGVPMEIAGGLVEAFGLFEAGKGIADWFDQDILGHHPKVNTTKLPTAPKVNNANLAIPSFDSVQDAPTSAGGW